MAPVYHLLHSQLERDGDFWSKLLGTFTAKSNIKADLPTRKYRLSSVLQRLSICISVQETSRVRLHMLRLISLKLWSTTYDDVARLSRRSSRELDKIELISILRRRFINLVFLRISKRRIAVCRTFKCRIISIGLHWFRSEAKCYEVLCTVMPNTIWSDLEVRWFSNDRVK
jgi:hypothetical protein